MHSAGPISEEIGYFFDLNSLDKEGFRDFTNDERLEGSLKLIIRPFPNSKLTLRGQYIDRDIQVPADLSEADLDADPSQKGGRPNQDDEVETVFGSFKFEWEPWEFGKWDLSFIWRNEDVDGLSRFTGINDTERNDINGKLMYSHEFDSTLPSRVTLGTDIYYGDTDFVEFDTNRDGTPDINQNTGVPDIVESSDSELMINAAFAQYELEVTDKIRFIAGVRAENIQLDSKDRNSGFSQDESFTDVAPKFGITYDFHENHRAYANLAEGFLAPDIDELFAGFGSGEANPELEPEEASNFDIGVRGTFLEEKLAYETAFYYLDVSNFIVETEDACGENCNLLTNAGEVDFWGFESVVEYWPIPWLRFGVTHTFSRNEYKEFNNAGADLSGNEIRRTPKHHFNGRIAWLPLDGLELELEADYYDGYHMNDDNTVDPRGRWTRGERINLRLNYETGRYRFWAHWLNITDTLEDRGQYSTRSRTRSFRTVDGETYYAGVGVRF